MPPRLHRPFRRQTVQQVSARKAGGAGDERKARHASAMTVLALVVLAELGIFVLDRTPPALVVAVPLHRLGEPLLERLERAPPERLELRGIERVAAGGAPPPRRPPDYRH